MEDEIENLKTLIAQKEQDIEDLKSQLHDKLQGNDEHSNDELSNTEISKYSRHLIMPEIGVSGQLALKNASVLIVGAGGLGCPAGLYLAAAGIGKIGIVDYDSVELSNLHRQIAHGESSIGVSKSSSFAKTAKNLNQSVKCLPYNLQLNESNIGEIISLYDIILDASDNVPTRYLLNDAAVLYKKPLVSGSALRFEGQLIVYNYDGGPCYRCLFPVPPPLETVTNCSEGGIIGAVTGVIGSLQALEVIKIAIGLGPSFNKKMLIFEALEGDFKVIKLRGKKSNCDLCGSNPSIKNLIDYKQFCNSSACDVVMPLTLLPDSERISCKDYMNILTDGTSHILLDIRPSHEIAICHLPHFINIELNALERKNSLDRLKKAVDEKGSKVNYVVCRRGNDSQRAVKILSKYSKDWSVVWFDIRGGLQAWHSEIDPNFPLY